jgi:hypothetical protein
MNTFRALLIPLAVILVAAAHLVDGRPLRLAQKILLGVAVVFAAIVVGVVIAADL